MGVYSVGLEGAEKDTTMRRKADTEAISVAEVNKVTSSDASSSSTCSSSFILQYINIKLIKMLPFCQNFPQEKKSNVEIC